MNSKEANTDREYRRRERRGNSAPEGDGLPADPPIELSVIIPAFNEEESLGFLYQRLIESLDPLGIAYEVILVDDGSSDSTFEQLAELAACRPAHPRDQA